MPFSLPRRDEIQQIGAGVVNYSVTPLISSYNTFESGLVIGRFAKLDSGSLDNLDASASPVLAGVVVRDSNNAIQSGGTYVTTGDGAVHQVSAIEKGQVTVEVDDGLTITKFESVYAINTAGADIGKATNVSSGNVKVGASYFVEEVRTNVWKIQVDIEG